MKQIEGMRYRQWQQRNTELFNSLAKEKQKEARQQGYRNVGWLQVQKSWDIIFKIKNNLLSLFEHRLHKGDVIGAIHLSLFEAEKAKNLAQKTIYNLNKNQHYLDQLAEEALAKHLLL